MNEAVIEMDFERRTVASFDGTPIGVQVAGAADAPVLLMANGLGATVSAYRFILDRFRHTFRFVSWDYRGLFGSGRPVRGYAGLSVVDHAKDALAVLDAVSLGKEVHALGWSMGVQVLLEVMRQEPERFDTLVLHNGVAGRPWSTLAGGFVHNVADGMLAASQKVDGLVERAVRGVVAWDGFVPLAIRLGLAHHDLDRDVFIEAAQGFRALDMHVVLEIMRRLGEHDAYDVLAQIACPTLVIQGTEDKFTPLAAARRMAEQIPGATLALVPGGTHYAAHEMPALLNEHLESFWKIAGLDT